jgi:hydrogenase expression/formation protein HypC
MCLAIPGQIIELDGDEALVDFKGNRMKVAIMLVPEASEQDWVLVHAGFAITLIDEEEARITWSYLDEISELKQREGTEAAEDSDA